MKREEEQNGELDPFYKTPKLLDTFAYKLNNCHRYKQCRMTFRKLFYKKLKEGKSF